MFRKRQKVDRYWLNKDYMSIRAIKDMNDLNESQKRLKLVDGGEYEATKKNIEEQLEKMEAYLSIFDEQMGHPLDVLEKGFFDE